MHITVFRDTRFAPFMTAEFVFSPFYRR